MFTVHEHTHTRTHTHRVLELIISEQVEKLNVTLRGIETLSVFARDKASKLTELIGTDEVNIIKCRLKIAPPILVGAWPMAILLRHAY